MRGVSLVLALALGSLYLLWLWPLQEPVGWIQNEQLHQLLTPRALGWVLLVPGLLVVLSRTLADLPWQQRWLSFLFRSTCVVLLSLGLSNWVIRETSDRVFTVFLVDTSDSVSAASLSAAQLLVEKAQAAKRSEDKLVLVRFAARPQLVPLKEGTGVPELRREGSSRAESDLQSALQFAYGLFPAGYLKRVVLLSDGVETRGDVLAEAQRAVDLGVQVSTLAPSEPPPAEVAVVDVVVPDRIVVGQSFNVAVSVRSSHKDSVRVRLFQAGSPNGLDPVREVELSEGETQVKFRSVVRLAGNVAYRAVVEGFAADQFAVNNDFRRTVNVPGRPRILYVEGQPARASYLATALGAQQFDVEVRSAAELPRTLGEMSAFDFFILSDVTAEQVGVEAQLLIQRYVRELGGGFLFAGGESGYSLGGWEGTELAQLLPVRMQTERRREKPGVAMTLVIDRSGSMTGLPLEMAKAACLATVETLRGTDLVEVIAFDSQPRRFVKMQPARYRARIGEQISTIQPGGGTGLFGALDAAFQDISVAEARKKHVVLLTDGQAETEGLVDLAESMIAERITLTAVGLGGNTDADLLRRVARAGGGRYHAVPDPNNLPRIFTRETRMISRQTAVQDWFPVHQTGAADFLRGVRLRSAPLLHGYVSTQLKPPPAQQILATDQGDPILARWREGLGWALAWTSDVKNRWAVDWLQWKNFGRFWGQLIREHRRATRHKQFQMVTQRIGSRVVVGVDALDARGAYQSDLRSEVTVQGPLPATTERIVPLVAVAPGRYEAEFKLDSYGSFLLSGRHFRSDEEDREHLAAVSQASVSQPYPVEYARLAVDLELLGGVARTTGGQFGPSPKQFFAPRGQSVHRDTPLWPRLVLWAMAFVFLDVLMRRVRIFDREWRAGRV